MKSSASALFVSAISAHYVAAATLYIPLLEPQPITADIEGVDASGHTTWRIGPGVPSGTLTDDSDLFASATLIAGPTDARLIENDSDLGFAITANCGLNGAVAVCTVDASAGSIVSTTVVTSTGTGFEVQVAATAAVTGGSTPSATPTASGTGGASTPGGSPAQGSGTSGSPPTATNSASGTPSPTSGKNGAGRVGSSVLGLGMSVAVVAALFF